MRQVAKCQFLHYTFFMEQSPDIPNSTKPRPGCLAVYKGRPALVSETGEKISITAAAAGKGTETLKVREKDIEVLHPGPLQNLAALPAGFDASGDAGADLRGAWELIESSGPVTLRELAELAFGGFTPQNAWKAWQLLAEGIYFSGGINGITAKSGEEVEAAEEKRRGKLREKEDREAFLERLVLHTGAGHPAPGASGPAALDPALDGRFLQDVEALAYGQSEKSRTMKDLGRSESPQEAHRLLLETAYWDRWINPHPRRWGLALAESSQADTLPEDSTERRDLTKLPAFAIDSPWSSDPDDAVSLENSNGRRILYVHVADPASVIVPSSPVDLEARARGATLYLPEATWRMLPDSSLSRFALGLDSTSPALTFKLTLNGDGTIADTEIINSQVRVKRLSYEETDILAQGTEQDGLILKDLFALGEANLERRLNAGGVNIILPEVHISVSLPDAAKKAGSEPGVEIRPIMPYRSAEMVRECMLLAGEGCAAWAAQRHIPFPYITQETGDLPAKPLPGLAGNFQLRRCMRPRSVSVKPGSHWGLGLEAYTQVTSPLRRYTDLLAHQQIKAALARESGGAETVLGEEELLLRLATGDAGAQAITQAERASKAHWIAVYLETQLAEAKEKVLYDAVVVEKRGNNTGIIIPSLALETQLGSSAGTPNDSIRIRLKSVRIPEAEAVFVPSMAI
jgi:exoribonuclease-2